MSNIILQATKRAKKVKQVRKGGEIPAVLYGHGIATETLSVPSLVFAKVYAQAGGSALVDIAIDGGQPRKALIHDVQRDPLTEHFLHVDLYEVRMTEKMKTKVPLKFAGEAPAVKEKGGLLVKSLDHLNITCLPNDLVHEITIDITGLTDFGKSIYVRDVTAPPGITILDKPTEPVVTVMKPKTEEELAKELAPETVEVKVEDAVKVQEKGKKEEGEEGAAAVSQKETEKGAQKPQAKDAKKDAKK